MKPEGAVTDRALARMLAVIKESKRLESLTNEQLVAECASTSAADLLIVTEMMDRLDPHWADEKTPPTQD